MGTIGEELKAAREKKGLTLRQVSEKTRIGLTFLKALEEEDYTVIPGDVFVVGFLRNYAKELGLDENDLAGRYKEIQRARVEAMQPEEKPAEPEKKSAAMKAGIIPEGKRRPVYMVLLAGLILGGALTAFALYMTREKPAVTAPPPQPPISAPVTPAAPLITVTTAAPVHNNISAVKPPEPPKPAPKAGLDLKLNAESESWYSYKADKGVWISGVLAKGKSMDIQAGERISLSLGNAGGVKAEFNGKATKPFGNKGEAVRGIVFTKDLEGAVLPAKKASEQNKH